MELETAFYIIGIVYMAVMLLLMIALVVAVIKIRAKINAVHKAVDDKIIKFTNAVTKVGAVVKTAKFAFKR